MKERLNGKTNIIVNFDPLLEAKLEVPQLVAIFFRELEQSIDDKKINIDLRELLESLNIMLQPNIAPH